MRLESVAWLSAATIFVATTSSAQTRAPAAPAPQPPPQKACVLDDFPWLSIERAEHANDAVKAFEAAGCKAGDIVVLQIERGPSIVAAQFCDFTQTIYTDDSSVVCRWVGKRRDVVVTAAPPR